MLLSNFWIIIILIIVKWYLILVLNFIFLVSNGIAHLFVCLLTVYIPWTNVYSECLSIFKLIYLFLYYWVIEIIHVLCIRYKSDIGYMMLHYCVWFRRRSFHCLSFVFSLEIWKLLILSSIYFLFALTCVVIFKKPLQNQMY